MRAKILISLAIAACGPALISYAGFWGSLSTIKEPIEAYIQIRDVGPGPIRGNMHMNQSASDSTLAAYFADMLLFTYTGAAIDTWNLEETSIAEDAKRIDRFINPDKCSAIRFAEVKYDKTNLPELITIYSADAGTVKFYGTIMYNARGRVREIVLYDYTAVDPKEHRMYKVEIDRKGDKWF